MKFLKKLLLPILIIILSSASLIIFHTVSIHNLWNGYQTLAVSKRIDEKTVLAILENEGCADVVSLSQQKGVQFSKYSPVIKLPENDTDNYESKKNKFFSDATGEYQVYYIPKSYSKAAESTFKILTQNHHVAAYIDSKSRLTCLSSVLCLIFSGILCFLSSSPMFFAVTALFPFLFTLSQPFFADAGAICMMLYGLFAFQNFRRRRNAVRVLLKNIYAALFFVIPIFMIFLTSISSGFICLFSLMGAYASERVLFLYEDYRAKKSLFRRTLILPSEFISIKTPSNIKGLFLCLTGLGALLLLFMFSAQFLPSSFSKDLLLPVPARYNKDKSIISISDYVDWNWFTTTYPYRSLHEKKISAAQKGETVVIPRFEKTNDGIKRSDEVVFSFDDGFINSVIAGIDKLPDLALEKMLKKQGNQNAAMYSSSGKNEGDFISLFVLILEFAIPLICFILLKTRKQKL